MDKQLSFQSNQRTPLSSTKLSFEGFSCSEISLLSASGASGLVYEAYSHDFYGRDDVAPARLIIKECYPISLAHVLVRDGDLLKMSPEAPEEERSAFKRYSRRFIKAFDSNIALYQSAAREQISIPSHAIETNGTVYIINNASNGDTLDKAFSKMGFYQQVETLARLCETLSAIHDAGFVHLDIKPENVLCVRSSDVKSEDAYYSDIRLFDFDTVTALSDLSSLGTEMPNSGDWSSFEQTHPSSAGLVGATSDIYAVGTLLFWSIIGRPPTSNEVIHANGKWHLGVRDFTRVDEGVLTSDAIASIASILNATLTINTSDRYSTASDLAAAFKHLGELIMPVGETMLARFDNLTAGQRKLEQQMSDLLQHLKSDGDAPRRKEVATPRLVEQASVNAQEAKSVSAGADEPPESDVVRIASQASVMAARVADLNVDGMPEWLRDELRKVSSSGKKALLARDKDTIVSLAEKSETLCSAAMAFATIGKLASLKSCPQAMAEAAESASDQLEGALASDDLALAQGMVNCLEMTPSLLTLGIKLSTMLSSLDSKLSDEMRQRVVSEINDAASAVAKCDEAAAGQALTNLEGLEPAVAEDAYMGMLSAYL